MHLQEEVDGSAMDHNIWTSQDAPDWHVSASQVGYSKPQDTTFPHPPQGIDHSPTKMAHPQHQVRLGPGTVKQKQVHPSDKVALWQSGLQRPGSSVLNPVPPPASPPSAITRTGSAGLGGKISVHDMRRFRDLEEEEEEEAWRIAVMSCVLLQRWYRRVLVKRSRYQGWMRRVEDQEAEMRSFLAKIQWEERLELEAEEAADREWSLIEQTIQQTHARQISSLILAEAQSRKGTASLEEIARRGIQDQEERDFGQARLGACDQQERRMRHAIDFAATVQFDEIWSAKQEDFLTTLIKIEERRKNTLSDRLKDQERSQRVTIEKAQVSERFAIEHPARLNLEKLHLFECDRDEALLRLEIELKFQSNLSLLLEQYSLLCREALIDTEEVGFRYIGATIVGTIVGVALRQVQVKESEAREVVCAGEVEEFRALREKEAEMYVGTKAMSATLAVERMQQLQVFERRSREEIANSEQSDIMFLFSHSGLELTIRQRWVLMRTETDERRTGLVAREHSGWEQLIAKWNRDLLAIGETCEAKAREGLLEVADAELSGMLGEYHLVKRTLKSRLNTAAASAIQRGWRSHQARKERARRVDRREQEKVWKAERGQYFRSLRHSYVTEEGGTRKTIMVAEKTHRKALHAYHAKYMTRAVEKTTTTLSHSEQHGRKELVKEQEKLRKLAIDEFRKGKLGVSLLDRNAEARHVQMLDEDNGRTDIVVEERTAWDALQDAHTISITEALQHENERRGMQEEFTLLQQDLHDVQLWESQERDGITEREGIARRQLGVRCRLSKDRATRGTVISIEDSEMLQRSTIRDHQEDAFNEFLESHPPAWRSATAATLLRLHAKQRGAIHAREGSCRLNILEVYCAALGLPPPKPSSAAHPADSGGEIPTDASGGISAEPSFSSLASGGPGGPRARPDSATRTRRGPASRPSSASHRAGSRPSSASHRGLVDPSRNAAGSASSLIQDLRNHSQGQQFFAADPATEVGPLKSRASRSRPSSASHQPQHHNNPGGLPKLSHTLPRADSSSSAVPNDIAAAFQEAAPFGEARSHSRPGSGSSAGTHPPRSASAGIGGGGSSGYLPAIQAGRPSASSSGAWEE